MGAPYKHGAPISAIKLPVAGFRRQSARRFYFGNTLPAAQTMTACGIVCPLWRSVLWTLREERTSPTNGRDTTARLRVVSKCALREKREASRLPGTLQNHRTGLNSSHKKSSNCSKLIPVTFGNAFSKIAPSWIKRRVLAFRSFARSRMTASSYWCLSCSSFFSFSVKINLLSHAQKKGGS